MNKKEEKYKRKIRNRATLLLIINIIECVALVIIVVYSLGLIIMKFLPPGRDSSWFERSLHSIFIFFMGSALVILALVLIFLIPGLIMEIFRMIDMWKNKYEDDYVSKAKAANSLLFSTEVIPFITIFLSPVLNKKYYIYLALSGIIVGIRLITSILILRIKSFKNKIEKMNQENTMLETKEELGQNNIDGGTME